MKSLIFLNKNINDYNNFKNSLLDNHTVIDYNDNLTIDNIINNISIDKLNSFTHLTFIYHNMPDKVIPFFNNNFNQFNFISDELFNLIKYLKTYINNLTIDLLTCFVNNDLINEFDTIKNELNVDFRYTTNNLGFNNWYLTSHEVDIKDMYFNDNIESWKQYLGLLYLEQLYLLYPSLVTKTGQYYTLTQDISLPTDIPETQFDINQLFAGAFFLINGDTFDGNGYTITCTLQNNGLFMTPTVDGDRCTVKNLKIISTQGINQNMGGFVPSQMGNITISNCISECPSGLNNNYTGGFTGRFFGFSSMSYIGYGLIENCTFIGNITGQHSGGIGGYHCGNHANITIRNCSSSGDITGDFSGGICGSYAGYNGSIIIDKCYSTGEISGLKSGGICGAYGGTVSSSEFINGYHVVPISSYIQIKNCYSTGDISGNESGGITGAYFAGYNDGPIVSPMFADMNANLQKCWSSGEILGNDCGGITGSYTNNQNVYSNSLTIEKCYSLSKNITTTNSGGICGSYAYGYNGIAGKKLLINNCYSIGEIGATNGGIIGGYSKGGDIDLTYCIAYNINNSGTISILGGGIIGPNSTALTPRVTWCTFESYDNNTFNWMGNSPGAGPLIVTASYKSVSTLRFSIDFLTAGIWIAGAAYNDIYPRLYNFTNPLDDSFDYKYITYLRSPNYYFSETEENTIVFINNYGTLTDNQIIDLRDWMIKYIFDQYNKTGFELSKDSMGINNMTLINKQKYVSDKYIIYRPNNAANPLVINPYGSVAYKGVYCPLFDITDEFHFKSSDSAGTLRIVTKTDTFSYLYNQDSLSRNSYYTYAVDKLRLILGSVCIVPLILKPIEITSVITTPNVTPATLTTQITFVNDEPNATGYRIINYYYDELLNCWVKQLPWPLDVSSSTSSVTDTNWIGFPYDGKLYGYRVVAKGDGSNWFDSYEYYPVVPYNYPYMVISSAIPQTRTENVSALVIDDGIVESTYITAGITIDSVQLTSPKQYLIDKNISNQLVISWNDVDTTKYLVKRYYYINGAYIYDTSFEVNDALSYTDTTWDTSKKIVAYTITAIGNENTTDSDESLKMPYFNNYSPYIIIADILCRYKLVGGIKTLSYNDNINLANYFNSFTGTELSNKRSQAFYEYFYTYGQNEQSLHLEKKILNFNSDYTKNIYKIINYDLINSTVGFLNLSNYNLSSYGVYVPLNTDNSEVIFNTNDGTPESSTVYNRITKYINETDLIFGLETGNFNDNYFIPDSDYTPYYINDLININRYKLIVGGLTFDDRGPIPCLTENTQVLTCFGYKNIKNLKKGDFVITPDLRKVKIKNILTNIVKGNDKTFPYIVKKNSITYDYPKETFTISGHHLIKYKNKWILPKNIPNIKQDKTNTLIKYYHIELENYETDNLVINNGTIVESFGGNTKDIRNYSNINNNLI